MDPTLDLQKEIEKFYENYNGAEDLRTDEEKAKDFLQTEFVASAAPVDWKRKKKSEFRGFPELNQFFTFKCVAFTTAKLALINFWLKTKEFLLFSPNSIYDYRVNKPDGGMIGDDAFQIWKEKGIALESVCKSTQVQESDPITISLFAKEVAKGFKLGNFITIPGVDFDRVASTIQTTGKGVMVWFYFTSKEWGREVPRVMDNLTGPYDARSSRHSVTAMDFGIVTDISIIDGEQVLKIEDSAHFGGLAVRYITRDFFEKRNFLIKYPMNFNYEEAPVVPPSPGYHFTLNMKLGDNNSEVMELQKYLQKLGYYPNNISTPGNFGPVTKDSVIKFQLARGLVGDGVVGPKTLLELNKN